MMVGVAALAITIVLVAAGFAITTLLSAFSNRSSAPVTAAQPTQAPLVRPALDEDPPLTPTAEPTPGQEFVRIANTSGTGAFIRDEPRSAARGIAAHTDRTVLKIIGPDVQAEGRAWRNVEDQRGNRGWTPSDFLVASDVGF
jgi:hypothetical protein